uniref:Uncharacterized protein n=1 Tax=Macaca fascicularis TaxID=9541 RepID=A0A7N9D183_MACFA
SARLGLPKCWDYRLARPALFFFINFLVSIITCAKVTHFPQKYRFNILNPYHFTLTHRHISWILFFFFLKPSLTLLSRLECSGVISAHCNLGSSNSLASASRVTGTTGVSQHVQLIFVFLVETGFTMLARLVSNS